MSETPPSDPGARDPLRVADLFALLPRVVELRPFLDLLIMRSATDPDRRWAGSGELGTVGDRVIDPDGILEASRKLVRSEADRLERLVERASAIVEAFVRDDPGDAVDLLIEQGRAEEDRGREVEAEAWYMAAHRLAKDHGLPAAPRALRMAARTARAGGRLGEASRRYEDAWRGAVDLDLEDDTIIAAIGRGNVEVDRGRWSVAELWYERALARLGEGGPPRRERWQVLQNLAIVHRRSRKLDEARRCLELAASEGERLADPKAAVEVENGWGQLLLAEGDPRGAELHLKRAFELAREPRARVTIGVNIGEALLAQGRTLEAAERARQAEAEALAGGVTVKLPEVYRLLTEVSVARDQPEAFVLLERALELIREGRLPAYEEALTREAYGRLRLAQGDEARGRAEMDRAAEIYSRLGADRATSIGSDAGEAGAIRNAGKAGGDADPARESSGRDADGTEHGGSA